jgi:hypothetical protein
MVSLAIKPSLPSTVNVADNPSASQRSSFVILHRSTKRQSQFEYLAEKQQTLRAILPVHTKDERMMFNQYIAAMPMESREPNWLIFAVWWSRMVNDNQESAKLIYYKTPGHLKSYYSIWKDHSNQRTTILRNQGPVAETRAFMANPSRVRVAPPASDPTPAKVVRTQNNQNVERHLTTAPQPLLPVPLLQISMLHNTQFDHRPRVGFRIPTVPVSLGTWRKSRTCVICRRAGCRGSNRRNRCPSFGQ